MKTQTKIEKKGYNFERSTYNPALDYLIGKELCKEKVDDATAFLIEHGLPKKYYEKK
jgi:protoheme ferro-lyase